MMSIFLLLSVFLACIYLNDAKELVPSSFQSEVLDDSKLWLVEFYSDMCGSCKEFAPTWNKVEANMKSLAAGKINIDNSDGMKLAQSLGVLEEGIPNIRLFHKKAPSTGVSIMKGEEVSVKEIIQRVRHHTTGLTRSEEGFFVKEL